MIWLILLIWLKKYKNEVDKESAYEILAKRMEQAEEVVEKEVAQEKSTARQPKEEPGMFEQVMKS